MGALRTTGIGSVPMDDIAEAVRFSFEFDVPFLPETPSGGDMLRRGANVLKSLWPPETDAFLTMAQQSKRPVLKAQVAGPVTLGRFQSQKGKLVESGPYCEALVRFFFALTP
jgi:hypothetical protein